ncbi:MAG: DUF5666 domain-containing protein [Terracidiphilus sp.]|jgi:hypothetical protein
MKIRLLSAIVIAVAFTAAAGAQDSGSAPPAGQNAGQNSGQGPGSYGQRGGRGGYGGGMGGAAGMMMGRGLMGTVTAVAADHYTIKTDAGDVYTVHFTADTRIFKQVAGGMRGPGEGAGAGAGQGSGGGQGPRGGGGRGYGGGNPPQEIKSSDIKIGDAIAVMGNIDATAKSAAATRIAQLDPAVVQQIRAMQADFGKTWLMGKVTAIDGTKITLIGAIDNAPHTVVADENTAFRKRRDPITLADIQVGDTVRAEGAMKDGVFTATSVNVFGMGGSETPTVPRNSPPQ